MNAGMIAARDRRPVRILFFTRETFPTFRVDIDVLFGTELIGRGHEIDLVMQAGGSNVTPGPHVWRGRTVWIGRTDPGDSAMNRMQRLGLGFWHDLASLRHARHSRYDAVQVRDKFLFASIALLYCKIRGLQFYFWLSFPEPESQLLRVREGSARYPVATYLRGRIFHGLLYRWILPRSDHVFVQSEQMKRDVSRPNIDPAKITPVPMGVAASDVVSLVRQANQTTNGMTLGYLGTLNSQRKLEVLVDMLSLLVHDGRAVRLIFVGDGEYPSDRAILEDRAKERGVNHLMEITGFLPRSEALARISSVDICLSPFFPTPVLLSTSPTKLVEYMALGLPVVANDHPEQRLVLKQSKAGICVPWGARYFAKGVAWLMKQSPQKRDAMGEKGRQWVMKHRTYERIADELERQYLQLAPRRVR